MRARGHTTAMIESATGRTCDIRDPTGNIIGFADDSRRPEMTRRR